MPKFNPSADEQSIDLANDIRLIIKKNERPEVTYIYAYKTSDLSTRISMANVFSSRKSYRLRSYTYREYDTVSHLRVPNEATEVLEYIIQWAGRTEEHVGEYPHTLFGIYYTVKDQKEWEHLISYLHQEYDDSGSLDWLEEMEPEYGFPCLVGCEWDDDEEEYAIAPQRFNTEDMLDTVRAVRRLIPGAK